MNMIFRVLNWLPFFHVSVDSHFGSLGDGDKRYTLAVFSAGNKIIYLISIFKAANSYKFSLYYVLHFYEICKVTDPIEMDKRVKAYGQSIKSQDETLINNQVDFLRDKISMNQSRTESGYNKINLYTAFILAHIGFIVYLAEKISKLEPENHLTNYTFYLLFAMAIYYSVNGLLFIREAASIKGYVRSTFKELKVDSSVPNLAVAYYTDWSSTNNESHVITSIVAVVEKYFIRGFVLSLAVWSCIFISTHVAFPKNAEKSQKGEFLIFNESGDFQKSEFASLLSDVDLGSKKIYVVSKENDANALMLVNFMRSTLEEPTRVIEIDFKHDVIDKHSVIIRFKD